MNRRSSLPIAIVSAVAVLAALGAVAWIDTTRPVLRENVVTVPGISGELRILHVSDLHAARFGPRQSGLERVLAGTRFDAAVITGDLLVLRGGDRTAAFDLVEVLKLHTDAVLFVPGNHDDAKLSDELASRGAVVVRAGEVVRLGSGGAHATVISADRDGRISAQVAVSAPLLIVAMHQPPDAATLATARRLTRGAQVFLAGHTHAGQIRIPGIGALWAPIRWADGPPSASGDEWFPELRGIQVNGVRRSGDQVVEITPGLGTTTVPVRLFDPAELTVLRLVPAR
jgi:predicted MPP superfamily phosphohydrolase